MDVVGADVSVNVLKSSWLQTFVSSRAVSAPGCTFSRDAEVRDICLRGHCFWQGVCVRLTSLDEVDGRVGSKVFPLVERL